MSLVKINSSKGLYQVLGGGLLTEPVDVSSFSSNGTVDTSLGFHLRTTSAPDVILTLSPPTSAGQMILLTNIGSNNSVLEPATLAIGANTQGDLDWDLPAGQSVLFVATEGLLWSPTSQSLQ